MKNMILKFWEIDIKIESILRLAYSQNVDTIDTAKNYNGVKINWD